MKELEVTRLKELHAKGVKIEFTRVGRERWKVVDSPKWNTRKFMYRRAPIKIAKGYKKYYDGNMFLKDHTLGSKISCKYVVSENIKKGTVTGIFLDYVMLMESSGRSGAVSFDLFIFK